MPTNQRLIARGILALTTVGGVLFAWEALNVDHGTWETMMFAAIVLQCFGLLVGLFVLQQSHLNGATVQSQNETNN